MMLRLRTLLLTITTLLSTATATAIPVPVPVPVPGGPTTSSQDPADKWSSTDWTGRGQIRTRYIGDAPAHPDLGCLTAAGQWTTNEALCGVFETAAINNYTFYLSSVPGGGSTSSVGVGAEVNGGVCGINVSTFKCGGGVSRAVFGTFGNGGPIVGHPVLRYAQYGVMATNAEDSPPAVTQPPLAIHFYTGIEKGKWVWLAWKSLGDDESEQE